MRAAEDLLERVRDGRRDAVGELAAEVHGGEVDALTAVNALREEDDVILGGE